MNRKQKMCLLVGIVAIVVMGLFPPWVIESKEITRLGNRWECKYITEPGPYSWIGEPPARPTTYNDVIDWDNSPWIKLADIPVPAARPKSETAAKIEDIMWAQYVKDGGTWDIKYKTEIDKPPAKARFIDLYRLGNQYFLVAVATAGLILVLGDRKRSK